VLTVAEMQAILDACDRLRERLLFALLAETGIFSAGHPLRRKLISRVCAARRLMGRR
jgi:integrase